jgi:hypothetical protein
MYFYKPTNRASTAGVAETEPQPSRKFNDRSPLRATFNYDVTKGQELLNRAKNINNRTDFID